MNDGNGSAWFENSLRLGKKANRIFDMQDIEQHRKLDRLVRESRSIGNKILHCGAHILKASLAGSIIRQLSHIAVDIDRIDQT